MSDINKLLGINECYQAPERIMQILKSTEESKKVFMNFITEFKYDFSYDWFHEYFEDEHADRKVKKQDFTPDSLTKLLSKMINPKGILYEPAAGTGGMIIKAWWKQMTSQHPFDYNPLNFFVIADEMSDRTIPFLLFNLMIRGINANVVHCNSLTRECKEVYFLFNEKNDYLSFSKLYIQPHKKILEDTLNIKFI